MDTREVVVPTNRSLMSRRDPRGRYKTTKQIPGENNRRTAAHTRKVRTQKVWLGMKSLSGSLTVL